MICRHFDTEKIDIRNRFIVLMMYVFGVCVWYGHNGLGGLYGWDVDETVIQHPYHYSMAKAGPPPHPFSVPYSTISISQDRAAGSIWADGNRETQQCLWLMKQ